MRRVLIVMGIVTLLGVLLVRFGSGMLAGKAASQYFAEQGIPVRTMSIGHASLRGALINEAVLGREDAVNVSNARIDYGYRGQKLNLYRVAAGQIKVKLRRAGGAWDIGGVEKILDLPSLDAAKANDSMEVSFDSALDVSLQGEHIHAASKDGTVQVRQGDLQLDAAHVNITLTPLDEDMQFDWKLDADGIVVQQAGEKITTPLAVTAQGTWKGERIEGQGTLADKGRTMPLILRFSHELKSGKTALQWTSNSIRLTEESAGFTVLSPLLEGLPALNAHLRMDGDAVLSPGKKPRIKHRIVVERAALSPLLKLAFKDDIAITGDLVGEIPLRWAGEKAPQIMKASLKNTAPGTLIYDPLTGADAALQQEEQAGILLEALRKFQYRTLDISASSDKDGVIKATFHLIGANPDLYGGKTIDFTLNVNGNLLSILESQAKVNDVIEQSKPKSKK